MGIRDKSGLFLLFLVLFASLSFAQFKIVPDQTTFENVQGAVNVPAIIYNDGNCHLSCSFGDQLLSADMQVGGEVKVELLVRIPGSCAGQASCPYNAKIACKELQDPVCTGKEYSSEIVFTFITNNNSGTNGPVEPVQPVSPLAPLDNTSKTNIVNGMAGPTDIIKVEPFSKNISGLVEGDKASMKTTLYNMGNCLLKCVYQTQGTNYQEEKITDTLGAGDNINFNVIFFVPESCTEPCTILAHVKCYDMECATRLVHETDVSFDLYDIKKHEATLLDYVIVILLLAGIGLVISKVVGFFKKGVMAEKGSGPEEGKRKLSAIMFTDVKGYSKAMGKDEEATLKKVWRYEKAMKQIIKEHDGRVVKTIGDAIMGDFDSAVNAVKAALEIQNLLRKEDIKIRIGIHLGDVIHKAGDVFGDGVNIASRIESICEPGHIYISEDVYNQVRGKIQADFQNLGVRPLKNIDRPPRVYRIK
jgi:class 3 adenylate cyclase